MSDSRKQAIIEALRAFINQRPGMEPRNYDSWKSYRSEYRGVLRDKDIALHLLRQVELSDSLTAEAMLAECGGGRLHIIASTLAGPGYDEFVIDYTTGQYFCVEYRAAAARYLASVLWTHTREHCMPKPIQHPSNGERYYGRDKLCAGDWLRLHFRSLFGKVIAGRFFS